MPAPSVPSVIEQPVAQIRPDFIVGFVGHRFLDDAGAPAIHAAIVAHLEQLKKNKTLLAISSAAIGADLLFAQATLETKIPLHVYLPFPEAEFRADFSEQDWPHAKRILEQAASVIVNRGHTTPPPAGKTPEDSARRSLAYADCARRIVDASDILLAVWDGKPARGHGGAQESIAYAKSLGKRLIIINATPRTPCSQNPTST